ncbi:MAG: hypothetical protein ACKOCQ_03020 [Candidatus Nitrosotenuis sp.]
MLCINRISQLPVSSKFCYGLLILTFIFSLNLTTDVFADHELYLKPISPTGLTINCGPNNPDCRNFPLTKSESIIFEMHASGVYSPISRFEISIDNQMSQFRNDGSCESSSCSSSIMVTKIRENVHQITIKLLDLTVGDHTIKIDSINWIDRVDGGKRLFGGGDGYKFRIIDQGMTFPTDGSFILPCSMQEKGDGVSSSSCNGVYENGYAKAKVGINYHSGLFPIKNYEAVGFFIDTNGNQGQTIKVKLEQIDPKGSKELVFVNPVSGFVKEFKMQMLGGTLVTEPPAMPKDGSFILPCGGQEKGDGVSVSSCNGVYENGYAKAKVELSLSILALFPIKNYESVGLFIVTNGNQGQTIKGKLEKIFVLV